MMDALVAVLDLLKRDADLVVLAADRIYGAQLPESTADVRGKAAVVLRLGAGVPGPGGYVDLQAPSFSVFCYGETHQQANEVYLAVRKALRHMRRQVVLEVLLHSFEETGAPQSQTDPELQWPYVVSSWRCLASETQTT